MSKYLIIHTWTKEVIQASRCPGVYEQRMNWLCFKLIKHIQRQFKMILKQSMILF